VRLEDIREVHSMRPFKPFALRLADGRRLEVLHSEFLAYAPGTRVVHFIHPDGRFERADVMLIVSIDELRGRGGNGRQRRKAF